MSTSGISVSSASSGGIDVTGTVDQIMYAERASERQMQTQQQKLQTQASAISSLQTQLSALQDKIDVLRDVTGPLVAKTAVSSQPSLLTATADLSATAGTHVVKISNLAATSSCYSDVATNGVFSTGTFYIQVGSGPLTTVALDAAHRSVASAANYINSLKAGVTASVVTDTAGSRLVLVSNTSGGAGQISISGAGAPIHFNAGTTGMDAHLTVDGVQLATASNTVTGVLAGVTLQLQQANPDQEFTLQIKPDTGAAKQAAQDFVSAYNNITGSLNQQFAYNTVTGKSGVLSGDSTVRGVQQSLLADVTLSVKKNGDYTSLANFGITMDDDGTLRVNDSKLSNALDQQYDSFTSFFQDTTNGFAVNFGRDLSGLCDSIEGPFNVDLKSVNDNVGDIQKQIDDYEVYMANRQQQLIDQYSRIDTMLRQFSATQAQLTAELGSLK